MNKYLLKNRKSILDTLRINTVAVKTMKVYYKYDKRLSLVVKKIDRVNDHK